MLAIIYKRGRDCKPFSRICRVKLPISPAYSFFLLGWRTIRLQKKKPTRGFSRRTRGSTAKGNNISFLRPVAAQPPARRRHRGQGLLPLRAAQMYICAMLARTFSFSRGLVFLLHSPKLPLRKFSRYADRFCGNPQRRSASTFSVHIPPCYHFGAIRYQFFGKDRLSGQIAIRSLGRQTGHGKKIAIQPVSLSFPVQSISKPGEMIHLSGKHSFRRGGAVKTARFCCHLTAVLLRSEVTLSGLKISPGE